MVNNAKVTKTCVPQFAEVFQFLNEEIVLCIKISIMIIKHMGNTKEQLIKM